MQQLVQRDHRPSTRPGSVALRPPTEMQRTAAIVDHTLHFSTLLLRAGAYLLLATLAERVDCGPHLLAGVLVGDFAGFLLGCLRTALALPAATAAELVLFTGLFAVWWTRYAWPATPEFRALFFLAAFGVLVTRLGLACRWLTGNEHSGWD